MPLYTFECPDCGEFDKFYRIKDMPERTECPECGTNSKKVIVKGHGGYQRPDAEWIRGVSNMFEDDGFAPVQTRDELVKFYDNNKNIRPKEPFAGCPSRFASEGPQDEKTFKNNRFKKATASLAKMRRIEVAA